MSKQWKENSFKYLEKGLLKEFQKDQENKLNSDHDHWQPKSDGEPPINGEVAWPLIGEENEC